MPKLGRPFVYGVEAERPVTVSLRIPRELYTRMEHYRRVHQQSITDLLLDGLRLRLDTPVDPRDIIVSQEDTVIQELQAMIRAAVEAEMRKLSDALVPPTAPASQEPQPPQPAPAPRLPETPGADSEPPQAVSVPPAKAALVARLAQLRAQGLSLAQIAAQLQAEGVPTLSGKGQWQKGTVDKLLRARSPRAAARVAG